MTLHETDFGARRADVAREPRRRWLPQWRPRNVGRLFRRAVDSFRPQPQVDRAMAHRLYRAERRGLQLAILCRTLAFVAAGAFYVISLLLSNSHPTVQGLLTLGVLIGLGVLHFIIIGTRWDRPWLKFVTSSVDVLSVAALIALVPPNRQGDLPQIYAFRDHGIYMMFPFLALATLSFSPKLVVWTGVVGALGWWAGFLWVVSGMERTLSWSDLPDGSTRAVYEAVVFSPDFIATGSRMAETMFLVITALILAVAVARARHLFFGQVHAEAAREAEREQRARVTAQLGRYVPAAIVRKVVDDPGALTPKVRHGAVLVMDIRDFTAWADGRNPAEVIEELNTFLARCSDLVSARSGVVISFTGDGLLATFGTPLDVAAPERVALDVAQDLVACGRTFGFAVRIGVAAGPIAAGSVGSTERQAFTVYGDTVNRAARLEALAKDFDCAILTDATVAAQSTALAPCGTVELRGFSVPVPVFKTGCEGAPAAVR